MNVGRVSGISSIDSEWLMIIQRLKAYGKTSTGSKSGDINLLHSLEIEKAKQENKVSEKFLTISKSEQEKLQEQQQEKKAENNSGIDFSSQTGATALGEQLYLAIQMKKKKNI